jgi:hypothetical protein
VIYALIDPRDERVRYVGESKSPRQRFGLHCAQPQRSTRAWMRDLRRHGLRPILRVLDGPETEHQWIERLRPDLNVAPGNGAPTRGDHDSPPTSIKFSPAELRAIKKRAKEKGLPTLSAAVREACAKWLAEPAAP